MRPHFIKTDAFFILHLGQLLQPDIPLHMCHMKCILPGQLRICHRRRLKSP